MNINYDQPIRFKGCPGTECRLLAHDLPGPTPFVVASRDAGMGGQGQKWEVDTYSPAQFETLFENAPPALREWWLVLKEGHPLALCNTNQQVREWTGTLINEPPREVIHVREVLP